MENTVKFSIITVVYNEVESIEKTIKSVITQSYKNFEFIIIDGKSNDGTIEIINKYSDFIDLIIIEKDNGLYDAMNKGISIAHGDFAIFMNGGDTFYSESILYDIANYYCQMLIKPTFIYGDAYEKSSSGNLYLKKARNISWLKFGMVTHHQSMFYNINIIKFYQLFYNTKYKIAADYEFTIKFINRIPKQQIYKVSIPICIFSSGGVSSSKSNIGFREQFSIKINYYSPIDILALSSIQYIFLIIRKHFPNLYQIIRLKKICPNKLQNYLNK